MKIPAQLLLFILAIFLFGCSETQDQIVAPSIDQDVQPSLTSDFDNKESSNSNRILMGAYKLSLHENGEFDLIPIRVTEMHVDVTELLFPPKCLDCFQAELLEVLGQLWEFRFTIRNPTMITGYDARVTLLEQGDITLFNASSYTKTFALPGDLDPINPFVVFDSGNGQNEWGFNASAETIVTFLKPDDGKFTDITFIVDGSFPDNQQDPYLVTGMNADPTSISIDGIGGANIAVTVYDWQNNVNYVNIDLSALGGSGTAEMINAFANLWLIEDVHYETGGDGLGTHFLLITAGSTGQETYNYVPVVVVDENPSFLLDIDQTADQVPPGSEVEFTAIATGGNPDYFFDWDMDYDGITFEPDITGETVQWVWTDQGAYKIKLRAHDAWDQIAWEETTVVVGDPVTPSITVISPNGSEALSAGSDHQITWSSYLVTGTVYIQYSKDNFVSDFHDVAINTPNDGGFLWEDIPDDHSHTVRLRISSTDNPSLFDTSDDDFSIVGTGNCAPPPEITTLYLPDAMLTYDYNFNLEAMHGEGEQTWFINPGGDQLPDGLVIEPDGLIHGIPEGGTEGVYNLEIMVCDECDPTQCDTDGLTLAVIPNPSGWARTWGSGDFGGSVIGTTTIAHDVVTNADNNIYVCGMYSNINVDFDPGVGEDLHSTFHAMDIYLSKFDSSGNFRWSDTWGSAESGNDIAYAVEVDSLGNVYVAGEFENEVDFDPGDGEDIRDGGYQRSGFLSMFDPDGNYEWARTWGENGQAWCTGLAFNSLGEIFVVGNFKHTTDFDPGPGVDNRTPQNSLSGGSDAFMSKFDSSGNYLWVQTWGGDRIDECNDIIFDDTDNCYLIGSFMDIVDFDPGAGTDLHESYSLGSMDCYVSKFDSSSSFLWARTWGGTSHDECLGIDLDDSGNVYVTGIFKWSADFDPGPDVDEIPGLGYDDPFLSKFDPAGNYQWARVWGSEYQDRGWDVVVFESDVYVTGEFDYTCDFNPDPEIDEDITSQGYRDISLCKYTTSGEYVQVQVWGAAYEDCGRAITTDVTGNVYFAGHWSSMIDFDPGPEVDFHTCVDDKEEVFLLKLLPNGLWEL